MVRVNTQYDALMFPRWSVNIDLDDGSEPAWQLTINCTSNESLSHVPLYR